MNYIFEFLLINGVYVVSECVEISALYNVVMSISISSHYPRRELFAVV